MRWHLAVGGSRDGGLGEKRVYGLVGRPHSRGELSSGVQVSLLLWTLLGWPPDSLSSSVPSFDGKGEITTPHLHPVARGDLPTRLTVNLPRVFG